MAEEKRAVRWPYVLSMAFAMIAYYIGASTGTGQEFFQSYATHGSMGVIGVVIQQISLGALCFIVFWACKNNNLNTSKEFFIWFLGKPVGTIVYYYVAAFVFATLLQLISGTGAIINQFYGIPTYVGSIGLSILLMITMLLGFDKLIDVISKIAPFILVVMILVAISGLINSTDGFVQGSELALASENVYRTSESLTMSTVLHHSYLILFLIPYYVSTYTVDKEATKKEATLWITLSFALLIALTGLMVAAQVANFSITAGTQAPNVAVAEAHTPLLAPILVFMIAAASYTTTAPIALIAADYVATPGTAKHKISGIVIILIGLFVSFFGAYDQIINMLISVSGRIGLAVYAYAAIYRLYVVFTDSKGNKTVEQIESN